MVGESKVIPVLEKRHFPNADNVHSLPDVESRQRPLGAAVPCVLPSSRAGFAVRIVDGLAVRVVALKSKALLEYMLQRHSHAVVDRIRGRLNHVDRAEALVQPMEYTAIQQVAGIAV